MSNKCDACGRITGYPLIRGFGRLNCSYCFYNKLEIDKAKEESEKLKTELAKAHQEIEDETHTKNILKDIIDKKNQETEALRDACRHVIDTLENGDFGMENWGDEKTILEQSYNKLINALAHEVPPTHK